MSNNDEKDSGDGSGGINDDDFDLLDSAVDTTTPDANNDSVKDIPPDEKAQSPSEHDSKGDSVQFQSNHSDEEKQATGVEGVADPSEESTHTPSSDDNVVSISAEQVGTSHPKEPPETGFPPRDIIYKRSWPGKERFERNESLVMRTNPHITSSMSGYFSGGLLCLLSLILSVHYLTGATQRMVQNTIPFIELSLPGWWIVVYITLFAVGIVIILWAYTVRLHKWCIVTDQRTWVRRGVLNRTDAGSLNHQNINNVEEVNPFPLNLIDVGHVHLFTASTDSVELKINHLKDPSKWAQTIRNEKQTQIRKQQGDTGDDV